MGAAVFPSAENKVLPVVGVIYQPNDKLSFNLVPERPTITYALNKRLSVFIAGDMTSKEFKLDYPGLKNTTLAYKETYAGSGIQYRFNKYSQASFSGGWVFNRTLKYHDSLGKVSIKDGLYSEFRLELSF